MTETGYKRGDILIQSQPFAFIIITPYRSVYHQMSNKVNLDLTISLKDLP